MKTRQHRFNSPEAIKKQLTAIVGQEVNIVQADKTVMLGYLLSGDDHMLTIRNLRGKVTSVPITSISELYFDTKE